MNISLSLCEGEAGLRPRLYCRAALGVMVVSAVAFHGQEVTFRRGGLLLGSTLSSIRVRVKDSGVTGIVLPRVRVRGRAELSTLPPRG